jgi:hypothetical protein
LDQGQAALLTLGYQPSFGVHQKEPPVFGDAAGTDGD